MPIRVVTNRGRLLNSHGPFGCLLARMLAGTSSLVVAVVILVGTAAPATAAEWLRGPRLQKGLAQQVSVTWSGQSVRDALRRITTEYHVATMLDRRLDPGRSVELELRDVTLNELLSGLARQQQVSVTWLGPVAYFGPIQSVRQLRTVQAARDEDIQSLPEDVRRAVRRKRPLTWGELTTPRELFRQVAETYRVQIENLDRVPHDLWAAGSLPPLGMAAQLTLLGAGFDITFQSSADGKSIRLARIQSHVTLDRYYQPKDGELDEWVQRLSTLAPDAMVKSYRGKIAVRARIEDHEQIVSAIRGGPAESEVANTPGGKQRAQPKKAYSLKVEAPLGQLLAALGRQAGFELRLQNEKIEAAEIELTQVVSVDVKDATLTELLAAVLKPAGLSFEYSGGVVTVLPATAP